MPRQRKLKGPSLTADEISEIECSMRDIEDEDPPRQRPRLEERTNESSKVIENGMYLNYCTRLSYLMIFFRVSCGISGYRHLDLEQVDDTEDVHSVHEEEEHDCIDPALGINNQYINYSILFFPI